MSTEPPPDDLAAQAITRILGMRQGVDHAVIALEILTALRGRGWRPTQARPQPAWQATARHKAAPPTAEFRSARKALDGEGA